MAVSGPEDADDSASDTYQEEDDENDVKSLHSDALDDDSDQETEKHARKRKRAPPIKSRTGTRTKASSPRKRRKSAVSDEDEEAEGYGVKEGQQIVGKVIQAPKTGRGTCRVYMLCAMRDVPLNNRSSTGSDISKYVQLPFAAQKARMQRPRMVRMPSASSVAV